MTITIDEYTAFVRVRKVYSKKGIEVIYPVLGLLGELGELAEKLDDNLDRLSYADYDGPKVSEEMLLEAGDVLWYIVAVADDLGLTLHDVLRGYETALIEFCDLRNALSFAMVQAALMADKAKKILRDNNLQPMPFWAAKLRNVYLGLRAVIPSATLEAIMQGNVDKLQGRVARGTIHGNGDNR